MPKLIFRLRFVDVSTFICPYLITHVHTWTTAHVHVHIHVVGTIQWCVPCRNSLIVTRVNERERGGRKREVVNKCVWVSNLVSV